LLLKSKLFYQKLSLSNTSRSDFIACCNITNNRNLLNVKLEKLGGICHLFQAFTMFRSLLTPKTAATAVVFHFLDAEKRNQNPQKKKSKKWLRKLAGLTLFLSTFIILVNTINSFNWRAPQLF
jgi:hypothetical protein